MHRSQTVEQELGFERYHRVATREEGVNGFGGLSLLGSDRLESESVDGERKPQSCFTFATSALIFDQSYVTRVLHVGVAETGLATGLLSIGSIIAGNAFGGILSDKLAKRDITWLCRLPGYGMMLTFPFYIGAHLVPGLVGYSLLGGIAGTLMVGVLPAMMSAMLAVVGGTRRATGLAIAMLFTNLVGLTLGPIVTGMLSDHLALSIGPAEGLRWSLILALSTFYPTGWFMLRAARTIQGDFEI